MEPQYIGENGRIDALAVAWLFANDYIFFADDEIGWNGEHHQILGLQVNGAKLDEIPVFMENPQTYCDGIVDLLLYLENESGIKVKRSNVHKKLHRAIRKGDLTALTLFNLQACGQAFSIHFGNDPMVEKMKLMHESGDVSRNASGSGLTYYLAYDPRLMRGIPDFPNLVAQLIRNMLEYNDADEAVSLRFVAARSFDFDDYASWFTDSVAGAWTQGADVLRLAKRLDACTL